MSFGMKDALGLRVPAGKVDLKKIDPAATPGLKGKGEKLDRRIDKARRRITDDLKTEQRKLYANHASGENVGSVLVILQGVDTSGKGGATKAILNAVGPLGVKVASFTEPTEEELAHDFLWRIRRELPDNGMIGVFDRSHYEDVLVHRVEGLSEPEEIERRYEAIRDFEDELVANGTRIIKVFLHISPQFQTQNLLDRLRNPAKRWRYRPSDLTVQKKWDEYQEAYEIAIEETSGVPWYVLPSDNKEYARTALLYLLLHELQEMKLEWPEVDFNLEKQLKRVEKADAKAEKAAEKAEQG